VKAISTGDVSIPLLNEISEGLLPEVKLDVDDHQIFLKAAEPPSWVTLIADLPWWVQAMSGYAALYIAEVVKEAGKETWQNRAKLLSPLVSAGGSLAKLAQAIADLRARLSSRTRLEIALPFPDEVFPARLEIAGSSVEEIAMQVALFVHHLPALGELIQHRGLNHGSIAGGLTLTLQKNGSLKVSWQDVETSKRLNHVLDLEGQG